MWCWYKSSSSAASSFSSRVVQICAGSFSTRQVKGTALSFPVHQSLDLHGMEKTMRDSSVPLASDVTFEVTFIFRRIIEESPLLANFMQSGLFSIPVCSFLPVLLCFDHLRHSSTQIVSGLVVFCLTVGQPFTHFVSFRQLGPQYLNSICPDPFLETSL